MNRQISYSERLRHNIHKLLLEHPQRSLTVKQLLTALGMQEDEKTALGKELDSMQAEGLVIRTARSRYGLPARLDCLTGTLQGNRRGFAFLRPDISGGEDIFISPASMHDAVHGDRVMVRLGSQNNRRRKREGEVIGIIKRGHTRLVGTLEQHGKRCYVIPDESRLFPEIEVPRRGLRQARRGDKVVVQIQDWRRGNQPPRGQLVEVIGPAGTARTEQLALYHKFDLPGDFPPPVHKELDSLPREADIDRIAAEEKRRDLRDLPMVTIDDAQARDFDDAVSLEETDGGGYRLGVHIADVSQYVRENRALDREALKRGTSTYLVGQVIHMLPPLLAEGLCSLQAEKDRLAVSVMIDLSPDGELDSYRFYSSVIKVKQRLTYREVELHLNGGSPSSLEKQQALGPMLTRMSQLAQILRQRRLKRGSLDLDLPEARFELDEAGNPLLVECRKMGLAESLIEEFMILCNEVVAGHFLKEGLPFIYRVHANPTAEKLAYLRETLALLGNELALKQKELQPRHLNMLLEQSSGAAAEKLVRYLMLRSLPQARYSAVHEGHFGLASPCYCHFTSPIRRYPDLVAHRILKEYLAGGGLSKGRITSLQSRLPAVALQTSERERAAMEAERASADLKKAQYMENKLGEVYPGIISGVTNFGIFVELENTIEGMIPVSDLDDDYYVYQEKQAALIGERTRKVYRLGDTVTIQVVRVDRTQGKVTFNLASER